MNNPDPEQEDSQPDLKSFPESYWLIGGMLLLISLIFFLANMKVAFNVCAAFGAFFCFRASVAEKSLLFAVFSLVLIAYNANMLISYF